MFGDTEEVRVTEKTPVVVSPHYRITGYRPENVYATVHICLEVEKVIVLERNDLFSTKRKSASFSWLSLSKTKSLSQFKFTFLL